MFPGSKKEFVQSMRYDSNPSLMSAEHVKNDLTDKPLEKRKLMTDHEKNAHKKEENAIMKFQLCFENRIAVSETPIL